MATNPGVIVLTKTQLRDTQLHHRLDIEDNIGEEMHIHYKNFRMDYTVRDFLELARACDSALTNLQKYLLFTLSGKSDFPQGFSIVKT